MAEEEAGMENGVEEQEEGKDEEEEGEEALPAASSAHRPSKPHCQAPFQMV